MFASGVVLSVDLSAGHFLVAVSGAAVLSLRALLNFFESAPRAARVSWRYVLADYASLVCPDAGFFKRALGLALLEYWVAVIVLCCFLLGRL